MTTRAEEVLRLTGVSVSYQARRGLRSRKPTQVVRSVDLDVQRGEIVALVGESGSGKSTTARAICGLVPFDGEIEIAGTRVAPTAAGARAMAHVRQMVFQDPYSSLDPLMTVGDSIGEPLVLLHGGPRSRYRDKVASLLTSVNLPTYMAGRLPSALSGGQRQRVAIARAIATEPSLVICDEAVSALDASTQGEVLALLGRLRDERGLAFLFIAHDLALVRHFADRTAVMYFGEIVEAGPTAELFENPRHPYTRALLSAVPIPHPRLQRQRPRQPAPGDPPDPESPPGGCPFHPRCPDVMSVCRDQSPALLALGPQQVACHLYESMPVAIADQ